ncbi:hypothetical protein PPL_06633 [Heterostelium album PN500]|uniref:B box-type domain-containing protein n=1 Tax=Heterostelium pallidum (strain ATCC 26659 / Pp 5 / PN500) TaxID=670386 RepID=D3BFA0_HETP5|nr:hypothetical protein PPL_06633 [Heterostelium album PN500]EFA79814.1 hypothetical protein PPL_06633 [Heterostelium album PN500]|eukprot:XP_020431935.1 hypothetical protein PPL_06633 [Heterostelium album PN500]
MEELECSKHNKTYEYICFQCNLLFCYRCSNDHPKSHANHTCEHIDDIKSQLLKTIDNTKNINKNKNNSNSNENNDNSTKEIENNYIQSQIDKLWSNIKDSSKQYKSLEDKQQKISDHFAILHKYLTEEELKLKKPIINDIDLLKDQIKLKLEEFKSFIKIINTLKHNSNNTSSSSNVTDDNDQDNDHDNNENDTTNSIESIINSIQSIESVQQFIKHHDQTLFDYQNYNNNIVGYLKDHTDSIDIILLKLINIHNNQYIRSISKNNVYYYQPTTNIIDNYNIITTLTPYDIEIYQKNIQQTIKVINKSDNLIPKTINTTTVEQKSVLQRTDPIFSIKQDLSLESVYSRYFKNLEPTTISNDKTEFTFKFLLMGDSTVGKKEMINYFDSSPGFATTDFKQRIFTRDKFTFNLQLWDTYGFERMTSLNIPDQMAIFIVYDVTNSDSFENVTRLFNIINDNYGTLAFKILVGNKCDKPNRVIGYEKGQKLANRLGMSFMETSAKTGQGIEELFMKFYNKNMIWEYETQNQKTKQ